MKEATVIVAWVRAGEGPWSISGVSRGNNASICPRSSSVRCRGAKGRGEVTISVAGAPLLRFAQHNRSGAWGSSRSMGPCVVLEWVRSLSAFLPFLASVAAFPSSCQPPPSLPSPNVRSRGCHMSLRRPASSV